MTHNPPTTSQRQEDIRRVSDTLQTWIREGRLESDDIAKLTGDLLQLSKRTVKRYWKRTPDEQVTPGKKRKRRQAVRGEVDDFGRDAIRRIMYKMCSEGEHITLETLLNKLKGDETIGFRGGRTTLYRLLGELGFSWVKTDNRRALLENVDIVRKRIEFLREYRKFKTTGMPIIFLDETWFYTKGSSRRRWQDDSILSCTRRNLDMGKRVTAVHAGSKDGFVDGADLIFYSKKKTEDYHGTMTAEIFEKWLKEKLLNNLEDPSVIVLDNASYHSAQVERCPTRKWRKAELQCWLRERNITFNEDALCAELYMIAMDNKPSKNYRVDNIIMENGHQVLRLPPYHCHYNPIELVWHELKQYYDYHIVAERKFDEEAVKFTWKEALKEVTKEKWRNYVRHIEEIIEKDWDRELMNDENEVSQPFIIHVDNLDSEEDSEMESSEEILAVPL